MNQERVVDIIEDRRRYRHALVNLINSLRKEIDKDELNRILNESKVTEDCRKLVYPGPWPILTDHIALCETCKPVDQYAPGAYKIAGIGENEVVFQLCEGEMGGFALWKRFVDYRVKIKKEAEKKALQ